MNYTTMQTIQREVLESVNILSGGLERQLSESDLTVDLGERGLGLDSITKLKLLVLLEARFQIEFPDEYWGPRTFRTIIDISEFILGQKFGSSTDGAV